MAHIQDVEDVSLLIREFADAYRFRSATFEELELDGDYYRRPLRPEDLSSVDFGIPVVGETICDLPSLAAQRILRCIYDMQFARIPRPADRLVFERRTEFYGEAPRLIAARLAPFLERFAFGFVHEAQAHLAGTSSASLHAHFDTLARDAVAFAKGMRVHFQNGDFTSSDLRFLLVQRWCLGSTREAAIARAAASGFFDPVPRESWPRHQFDEEGELSRLAGWLDVNRDPHAFWQFYLPTTLAELNHLGALAGHPELSLAMLGASYVAELESCCFAWTAREAARALEIGKLQGECQPDLTSALASITTRFGRAAAAIEAAFGAAGVDELARGVGSTAQLVQLARRDAQTQLRWLASIDDYRELANRLDHRIRTQRPNIDRETFVEPREMCSTTHVHNDHRLVVIESGNMVFWARPDMRFRMAPGDRVLVPRGRLHGSSVESNECVYHQPIIPEEWVRPLIHEVDHSHGWRVDLTAATAKAS